MKSVTFNKGEYETNIKKNDFVSFTKDGKIFNTYQVDKILNVVQLRLVSIYDSEQNIKIFTYLEDQTCHGYDKIVLNDIASSNKFGIYSFHSEKIKGSTIINHVYYLVDIAIKYNNDFIVNDEDIENLQKL